MLIAFMLLLLKSEFVPKNTLSKVMSGTCSKILDFNLNFKELIQDLFVKLRLYAD